MSEEQINWFDQLEEQDRDARARQAVRDSYRKWLKAPALTPCDSRLSFFDYGVYDGIIHRCETMPAEKYMWENTLAKGPKGGEFWCLQQPDEKHIYRGTQMDKCPFCGVNLSAGEGARFLRKASGYVYSDKNYRNYYGLDEVEENP